MSIRLFVGLELSESLVASFESVGAAVRSNDGSWVGEKWVSARNIHVTTCFIGAIATDTVGRLVGELELALDSAGPFELSVTRVEAIPRPAAARMLWVSFEDASGRARELSRSVGALAVTYGARPDSRPYTAHATLCRARAPRGVSEESLQFANDVLGKGPGSMSVPSATLFSSQLTAAGPVYEVVARLPFSGM